MKAWRIQGSAWRCKVKGNSFQGGFGCSPLYLAQDGKMQDKMNCEEPDNSRDHRLFSPIIHTLKDAPAPPTIDIAPLPHSAPNFFEKFKTYNPHLPSAFKLWQPLASPADPTASKKPEIIRKHRGNYRKYTVTEKEEAVKQILQGVDAKEISEKYGIPRRNLLRWKKNGCERKEGGGRPTDGEMQLTLYTKIDNKVLVTEKEIRAEAKRLSKITDFKASKGWYCKFSRRYNHWKKTEREKAIKNDGESHLDEKELVLLPEFSDDSDSDSENEPHSSDPRSSQ